MEAEKNLVDPRKPPTKFFESNAGDGTNVFEHYLTGIPFLMCFGSCFLTLFLIGLDQTIVVPLYSTIGNEFNDFNNIGWIMSGYMLSMCVLSATWGRLSILYGRKWSLLAAIALFEGGSLMCALAKNMNVLIGGRVLAGVGAGGVQTLVFVVGTELVPINKRPTIFVTLSIAFSIASIVGPLIGGGFATNITWRWAFYLNLPIGGFAAVLLILFFHPPRPKLTWRQKLRGLDYLGTLLSAACFTLFLLALSFGGNEYPWGSGAVISMFIISGLCFLTFMYWTIRVTKFPIIPKELLRIPAVNFTVFGVLFCFLAVIGIEMYIATYFQVIKNVNALSTGLHMLPLIISVIVSSILITILLKTTRYIKPYGIIGGILFSVGIGLMTLFQISSPISKQIGLLILPGFGIGFLLQVIMMSAQLEAPKGDGATIMVTTLVNFSRSLGGSIGANLCTTIFNSSVKNKMNAIYSNSPELLQGVTQSDLSAVDATPDIIYSFPEGPRNVILRAVMESIRNVFYTMTGVACLTFVITLFFSNKRIPKEEDIAKKEDYEKAEKREE